MGINPAGLLTTSGSVAHYPTVWYNRVGLDQLTQMNRFYQLTEMDDIPKRSGTGVQWYRFALYGANTQPHAEGTVGTSLTPASSVVTARVSEYADFESQSTLYTDTTIEPAVENAVQRLSYRAAISVDAITRTEFDANSGAELSTLGATFTAGDIGRAVAFMKGANIMPRVGGDYVGIIHPYITFDLQSDNSPGGFIDMAKYSGSTILLTGEAGKARGTRLLETTNVKTSGTAPDVLYWNYIVGKGAVGGVGLVGSAPQSVTDPAKQSFKINVIPGGPNPSDPEGMIGTYVSYRYVYVAKTLDSTNYRYRMVKANASLV